MLRSSEGLERLAGGIVPGETGRGWECARYDEQVIRLKMDEDTIAYLRAEADSHGMTCSMLLGLIVERWLEFK